jgi:Na+/melibiose symporter-like transporter
MLGFVKGVLDHFGYTAKGHQLANYLLFGGIFIWLFYLNINYLGSKQAFAPVIAYAVIGMLVIGAPHFMLELRKVKQQSLFVLAGILIMAISAVIFKAVPEGGGIKPSDVSHVLIAFSLVSLTIGFKKTIP